MKKLKLFLVLLLVASSSLVQGLNLKVVNDKSSITVSGTSTLHGWEMKVNGVKNSFTINILGDGIHEVLGNELSFEAKALKSDNDGLDSKAHEALKTDRYPVIKFTPSERITFKVGDKKFKSKVKGALFIAGVTKQVEIDLYGEQLQDGSLLISGKKPLKMTDFGITPPRAMLGTIRSGNDITVNFEFTFR